MKEAAMTLTPQPSLAAPSGQGWSWFSNALAVLCLVCAVLCLLAMLVNALLIFRTAGLPFLGVLIYNAYDALLLPIIGLALLAGYLSGRFARRLSHPPVLRKFATAGLRISSGLLAVIVGLWVVLTVAFLLQ